MKDAQFTVLFIVVLILSLIAYLLWLEVDKLILN